MTAIRPRDAASMLVYKGEGRNSRILMGRRRRRARFMPDVFVYPGGAVDPTDFVPNGSSLRFCADLCVGRRANLAGALAAAAVRETREETGLKFSSDFSRLRFVGRAITPTDSPTRFHARFFAAPFIEFGGDLGGDGELLDLGWFTVAQARALPLVDVTRFMLEELLRMQEGARQGTPLLYYRRDIARVRYY
jgi:8-oxo-dGTP pyrophosphatase MutT (NUDIX family)